MNIPRPEHIEAQYIYRDYGGYIFKLPRNKDIGYLSLELQEYYYWSLAEFAYKQIVANNNPKNMTQVANWELPTGATQVANWQILGDNSTSLSSSSTSRYIQLTDIKKPQRDKLISSALAHVFTNTYATNATNSNNPFQYIESLS